VDFRPIEALDMRWVFAAYKAGALTSMGFADGLGVLEFKEAFEAHVLANYDAAWSLFAMTTKGFVPVGIVFGARPAVAPYMIVAGVVWFPWASNRNIIEALVNFFNVIRKHYPLMLYALPEHRRAYEVCCMHSILHRVGTSHIVFPGKSAAVFETRA
jgi:hypothetical protein